MFTGIIEATAKVVKIENEGSNRHFSLESELASALKIDQSLAHNGVCLTVVKIEGNVYTVTAVEETLQKSNLGDLQVGSLVNLERSMQMNGRLDGHIVQGHVDQTGICEQVEEKGGSRQFDFSYDPSLGNILVEKGSVCLNGVSLTVFNCQKAGKFSVAIIPYTYEHTNFKQLKVNDRINLEFDILGKYVQKLLKIQGVLK